MCAYMCVHMVCVFIWYMCGGGGMWICVYMVFMYGAYGTCILVCVYTWGVEACVYICVYMVCV